MYLGDYAQKLVVALVVLRGVHVLRSQGPAGLVSWAFRALRSVPGVDRLVSSVIRREAQNAVKLLAQTTSSNDTNEGNSDTDNGDKNDTTTGRTTVSLPEQGVAHSVLLRQLEAMRAGEGHVARGQIFAYVYTPEDAAYRQLMKRAYRLFTEDTGLSPELDDFVMTVYADFMHGNALNPTIFPSLRQMENEILSMTADMLHGDSKVCGSVTSGGTESILMAMKTYRDYARHKHPHIREPEVIAPITVHPAHEKAASYFGLKMVHIPVDPATFQVDVQAVRRAINRNTILLIGSAPQYCQAVVDPIEELSDVAQEFGLPLHVDACFGGFMLPWVEKLGFPVPKFDFRVPGVTSMSADPHKYGFSIKGTSVILYRTSEIRKFQYFAYASWPGGVFGSPSMAGTRPGGNIAATWAVMKSLGQEGYMKIAKGLMDLTRGWIAGINEIPGLQVMGSPCMTAFAFRSVDPTLNILAIADIMETHEWKMERQQAPDCIHCSVMPYHAELRAKFLDDLRDSVKTLRENPQLAKTGTAAIYGMMGKLPKGNHLVEDFIVDFFSEIYR